MYQSQTLMQNKERFNVLEKNKMTSKQVKYISEFKVKCPMQMSEKH